MCLPASTQEAEAPGLRSEALFQEEKGVGGWDMALLASAHSAGARTWL